MSNISFSLNGHRQFGLIGKKLSHSFSKAYFTKKFTQLGINASYELYELAHIDELSSLLNHTRDLAGLNVTVPYKEAVIPFLDNISPEAFEVGAVNTIRLNRGQREGFNTDVYGFRIALNKLLAGTSIQRAFVLGTGGAAKAVAYVLQKHFQAEVSFVSRSPQKDQLSYAELRQVSASEFDLVVNTTPLGMYPRIEEFPDFPYQTLGQDHFAIDLTYNPSETSFLRLAREQGASTQNGMEMLIQQAEASWAIWEGSEAGPGI